MAELTNIDLEDINWEAHSILIRHGKGGKQRMVPFGKRTGKNLLKKVGIQNASHLCEYGIHWILVGLRALTQRIPF